MNKKKSVSLHAWIVAIGTVMIYAWLLAVFPVAIPSVHAALQTVTIDVVMVPSPTAGDDTITLTNNESFAVTLTQLQINDTAASALYGPQDLTIAANSSETLTVSNRLNQDADDVTFSGTNVTTETISYSGTPADDVEVTGSFTAEADDGLPVGTVRNVQDDLYFLTLQEAIDAGTTAAGETIELTADITTAAQTTVSKAVTIEGNNFTLDAAFVETDNSNNAAIGIIGTDNVTIQNIILDGANGTDLHGLNVYESEGVTVTNVTAQNFRSGMVVNGSTVTASDFSTTGNIWHGINVAPGSGVTDPSVLTISETSTHDDTPPVPHIFTDDIAAGVITVNDSDSQYDVFEGPNPSNSAVTARAYYLKTPDDEKPTFAFTAPVDGFLTGGDFTITMEATDNLLLDKVVANLKNASGGNIGPCVNETVGGTTHTTSCDIDVSELGDGDFSVRGNATDAAGNRSGTKSLSFTIDQSLPVISVVTPTEEPFVTNADFDITVRATDTVGLSQVVINIKDENGGHLGTCANEAVTGMSADVTCTITVADWGPGTYFFRTNARDTENQLSNTINQQFIIEEPDTTKPTVTITTPEDEDTIGGEATVMGTASDSESDITEVRYTVTEIDALGGTFVANVDRGTAHGTSTWQFPVSGLTTGFYRFKVQAFDEAGNSRFKFVDVEVDTEKPAVTILSPENFAQVVEGAVVVNGTSTDGQTDIEEVLYTVTEIDTLGGSYVGRVDRGTAVGTTTWTFTTPTLTPGFYRLKVQAFDSEGNWRYRHHDIEIITAPIIIIEPETFTISGIKWEDSDGDGAVGETELVLNGWVMTLRDGDGIEIATTTTSGNGEYSFTGLTAGTYTVTEEARDDWTQTGQFIDGEQIAATDERFGACEFMFDTIQSDAEVNELIDVRLAVFKDDSNEHTCSFGNQENEEVITSSSSGGSSTRVERTAQPTPLVLGVSDTNAAIVTCPFLLTQMQITGDNDPKEVMRLQVFLNVFKDVYGGVENPITGVFDDITDVNVKAFQAFYSEEILDPWFEAGIVPHNNPTGFVYRTTLWKINDLICPGAEPYPDLAGEDLTENINLD